MKKLLLLSALALAAHAQSVTELSRQILSEIKSGACNGEACVRKYASTRYVAAFERMDKYFVQCGEYDETGNHTGHYGRFWESWWLKDENPKISGEFNIDDRRRAVNLLIDERGQGTRFIFVNEGGALRLDDVEKMFIWSDEGMFTINEYDDMQEYIEAGDSGYIKQRMQENGCFQR